MLDEKRLRTILRDEVERLIARLDDDRPREAQAAPDVDCHQLLTIPELMRRYRRNREFICDLIRSGQLKAARRDRGRNGRPQLFVKAADAMRHPLLGGGA